MSSLSFFSKIWKSSRKVKLIIYAFPRETWQYDILYDCSLIISAENGIVGSGIFSGFDGRYS